MTGIAFALVERLAVAIDAVAILIFPSEFGRRSLRITRRGFLCHRGPNMLLKFSLWNADAECPLFNRLALPHDRLFGVDVFLDLRLCGIAPENSGHGRLYLNGHAYFLF